MPTTNAKQLISHLEGYIKNLKEGYMTPDQVAGNLLIIAEGHGAIQKVGEIYVKPIHPINPINAIDPTDQINPIKIQEEKNDDQEKAEKCLVRTQ